LPGSNSQNLDIAILSGEVALFYTYLGSIPISWSSFVSSRLPLLKLPQDVLDKLRLGKIEYTKATAIARVKNELERMALMEAAITESLSLVQINERIKSSRAIDQKPISLKTRYKQVSSRLEKAPVWENPKKQKALEKLLAQIESLLDDSSLNSND
jgi:ParB family transcriptional regulator, chromosome partitioning protein